MFKVVLEKYDEEIMNTGDSSRFRHKGKVGTSIKTKTGLIEYERVKYIEKNEEKQKLKKSTEGYVCLETRLYKWSSTNQKNI